jgi:hypothetical protein
VAAVGTKSDATVDMRCRDIPRRAYAFIYTNKHCQGFNNYPAISTHPKRLFITELFIFNAALELFDNRQTHSVGKYHDILENIENIMIF